MPLTTLSGGLEELIDESSGREIVTTPVVINRFEELTKKYEKFLGIEYARRVWAQGHVQDVVLPGDISLFLQSTHEFENHTNYNDNTGPFISQLIQNSYNAGNNDFEFGMNLSKQVDYFASSVSGAKERTVRVVITGEVGNCCESRVQHSTFTIEKVGNQCGQYAEHSIFTIGKAGNACGFNAKHSTFRVREAEDGCGYEAKHSTLTIGKAGDLCGWNAQYSTFTIEKAENDCGIKAEYSIFRTHNPEQFNQFKKSVPRKNGNALYLLSSDGSVLKGGKW